jgi:hypothetical protein
LLLIPSPTTKSFTQTTKRMEAKQLPLGCFESSEYPFGPKPMKIASGWLPTRYQSIISLILMVPAQPRAMISLSFGWDLDGLKIVPDIKTAIRHFVSIRRPVFFPRYARGWGANCHTQRAS